MTRPIVLVLAAGLAWGCSVPAQGPMPEGPERPAVTLADPEIRALARVLRLEDTRRYEATVFEQLAAGSEEVRRRVALAAGRIGDPAAVPLLIGLLDDDASTAVRA
ncbi:MAG: HEAT repeat domain-containing protein, partial [Longimicrobiales bacterium]|nr:HEAT repeat domain-containing protein [Longimicrobiales bacterium]